MTAIASARTPFQDVEAQVIACVVAAADDGPPVGRDAHRLAEAAGVDLATLLEALHGGTDPGDVTRVPLRLGERTVLGLFVGVGAHAAVDTAALRRAAAVAARNATKDATLAIVVPADVGGVDDAERARVMAEGAGAGAYAYTRYRTKNPDAPSLEQITLLPGEDVDGDALERGVARGRTVAAGADAARDLVNTPPAFKRPPDLAAHVAELAEARGMRVRVHDEEALREGGFGGLLGVGRGSSVQPRLVEVAYEGGDDGAAHVVLVGKGITFDSGGLSLKTSQGMATMKSDMSGAAAIVGALLAVAELGLPVRVTGLLALAENMPGGDATRVSDVLTHRSGTTVEVLNTDAEGRLVLADALAYGTELAPTVMIDLATLTGGQIVALGYRIAALMGTDDALVDGLLAAGRAAGEPSWRLPLPPEYREQLRSEVADLKNIGRPREAQSIIAGLFLKEFAGEVPWAHLDIAGPAFDDSGDRGLGAKGATGFGVGTLVRYLETLT